VGKPAFEPSLSPGAFLQFVVQPAWKSEGSGKVLPGKSRQATISVFLAHPFLGVFS
jgi:hypothetical protein